MYCMMDYTTKISYQLFIEKKSSNIYLFCLFKLNQKDKELTFPWVTIMQLPKSLNVIIVFIVQLMYFKFYLI